MKKKITPTLILLLLSNYIISQEIKNSAELLELDTQYCFIQFHENEAAQKLKRAFDKTDQSRVVICHYGASHIQSEIVTTRASRLLKQQFGDAGPGYIFPFSAADTYDGINYKTSHTGFANQIRYVFINAVDARGACWARHLAQSLYQDEQYFLQIDSHSWFDKDWDDLCIGLMESNFTPNPKKMYSCYARGFEFIDGKPTDTSGTKDLIYQRLKPGESLKESDPLLALIS